MNGPKGLETAVNESPRMETRCASYFILVKTPGQGSWNRGGGARGGHPFSISAGLLTQIIPTTLQLAPPPVFQTFLRSCLEEMNSKFRFSATYNSMNLKKVDTFLHTL